MGAAHSAVQVLQIHLPRARLGFRGLSTLINSFGVEVCDDGLRDARNAESIRDR